MKKFVLILLGIALFGFSTNTYGGPWTKSVSTDITLTQNSYSDSWDGGESGNISWVWNANALFENQLAPKLKFRNMTRLSFGETHIQDKTTKEWAKPVKSTDLIDIENLGLFTLESYVDPYIGLRIESQFWDASVPGINRYLSPLKITESAGAARQFLKTDNSELLTRFGFAFRQIITKDIVDLSAKTTETNTTNDGGFESVTDFSYTLSENLHFISKLSLYKALFYSESDKLKGTKAEDYWKAVDVNWENSISAEVVKYVTVSLYTQLLYDKDIDLRGRFKETLSLGLTYKMF